MKRFVVFVVVAIALMGGSMITASAQTSGTTLAAQDQAALMQQRETLIRLIKLLLAQLEVSQSGDTSTDGVVTFTDATEPIPQYQSEHSGTLEVKPVGPYTAYISGYLLPPQYCIVGETHEFNLRFGDGTAKPIQMTSCKPKEFSVRYKYEASPAPYFVDLERRYLNDANMYEYELQGRARVTVTEPAGTIGVSMIDVTGGEKG